MYRAKVSPQGQLTLPKQIRKHMQTTGGALYVYVSLEEPSKLQVTQEDGFFNHYRGIAKPKPGAQSMIDILAELEREDNAKFDARGW
jgi:bifunctional DNA-binding transcriptional regulator/antitoxin component of YhaV-PrlF toxin-antitoxin module